MIDIFLKGIIGFLILLLVTCLTASWLNVKKTQQSSEKCTLAGGIPDTERSTYKACMKPDNFIKIEEK